MTDLTIGGETFRVEVEGDPGKPAVLLSNSLGTDLSLWDAQMPALAARFRVVRYDPRGHGRSTSAGAPYSLARLGADALAILDALAIERAHVVGISMGGAVGQWLLVNAPERIGRAVLANTSARFGTPDIWNARIRTVLSQGMQALATGAMERWFSDAFRASGAASMAAIDDVFRSTSPEGYAACCAALRDMDMREALRVIDRPVLIVTGRDDPVTSAADLAAMTDAIAGAQHVEFDCKHISNIEAQQAFDAAVIAFLTARTPARVRAAREPATRRPAGRATSARSRLKPAMARTSAAPARRRPNAKPVRAATKVTRPAGKAAPIETRPTKTRPSKTKTRPRKGASKLASARRVSPVAARGPVGKTAVKSPARKARPAGAMASAAKTPAAKTPAAKTPAAKTPAAKTPAAKTPAAKTPAAKTPAARPSAAKKAPVRKMAAKKTATKSMATKRLTKTTAKTPLVKKVIVKKAVAKKGAAKKGAARKSPPRRVPTKTPHRPRGR